MNIEKLTVYKSNRISACVYTPTAHTQVILGSNMSGKSTLMGLLIPWPAPRDMFDEGGFAKLTIMHGGDAYTLVSKHNGYNFFYNKIELNKAGGIVTQRKLCETHFGMSSDMVELLLGRVSFTGLSEAKRREWSMLLSKIDYQYVLSMYKRIRKDWTYAKNIITHTVKSIEVLSELPDIGKLHEEHTLENTVSEYLERIVNPTVRDVNVLKSKLASMYVSVEQYSSHIRTLSVGLPDDIDSVLSDAVDVISKADASMSVATNSISELRAELNTFATVDDMSALNDELAGYDEILSGYSWPYDDDVESVRLTVDRVGDDIDRFREIYDDLSVDPQERYDVAKTELDLYLDSVRLYDEAMAALANCVVCPECDHTFVPGSDVGDKDVVQPLSEEQGAILVTRAKAAKWYLSIQHLPYPWGTTVHEVRSEIARYDNMSAVRDNRKHTADIIDKLTATTEAKLSFINAEIDKYENIMRESIHDKDKAEKTYTIYKTYHNNRDRIVEYGDKVNTIQSQIYAIRTELIDTIRSQSAKKYLQDTRKKLTSLTNQIAKHDAQLMELAKLKETLKKYSKERDTLGVLVNTLSPKHGLVAHTLEQFHTYFTSLVNQYISHVWSTPLTVGLPDSKQRYPVSCTKDSNDISETSSGMREILDLGFRLAIQRILVPHWPLFLDEIGVKLDEKHRTNMYSYINDGLFNLYDTVYIISHYKELYAIFDTDSEFSVLDSNNIDVGTLPVVANTGLKI